MIRIIFNHIYPLQEISAGDSSNLTIWPLVILEKRSVIAAGSVITKCVEGNTIYTGVSAKLIKVI